MAEYEEWKKRQVDLVDELPPKEYSGGPKYWVPTYPDHDKYKEELKKDDNPKAAIFMIADSQLLFWKEQGFVWLNRVKCELPTRDLTADGLERPVKASYIGFANKPDEKKIFYDLFVAAMEQIGVYDCMDIQEEATWTERAHLEKSDIVVVGGGDLNRGWKLLENTWMHEKVKWRYYDGAVVIGVGAGATYLGLKMFDTEVKEKYGEFITMEAINIVPEIVACNMEEVLVELIEQLGPGKVGISIPSGGGLIFNRDGSFEPVRKPVTDMYWDWKEQKLKRAYMYPPEKGEGILVAMERMKIKEKIKAERGIRAMTKEEFLKYKEEEKKQMEIEEKGEVEIPVDIMAVRKGEHYREKGNKFFKMSDCDGAINMYKESLNYHPNNPVTFMNLSAVYAKIHKHDEAILYGNRAIRVTNGTVAKPWYRRGMAFMVKKDYDNAYQDFGEALVIEPGDSQIRKLEKECAEKMEDSRFESEQWMKDEKWKDDPIWSNLMETYKQVPAHEDTTNGRESDELVFDLSNKVLDLRGTDIFRRVLLDPYCKITHLILDNTALGCDGIKNLAHGIAENKNLILLSLEGCYIRAHGAKCLANALPRFKVSEINLKRNGIRDRGFSYLCESLAQHNFLEILNLAENHIGDKEASKLEDLLKKNSSIRELNLNNNQLGWDTARALAAGIKNNKKIEKVHLNGNPLRVDSVWRLGSVCIGHPSMRLLSMRGVRLSEKTLLELQDLTKYKMVEILLNKKVSEAQQETEEHKKEEDSYLF